MATTKLLLVHYSPQPSSCNASPETLECCRKTSVCYGCCRICVKCQFWVESFSRYRSTRHWGSHKWRQGCGNPDLQPSKHAGGTQIAVNRYHWQKGEHGRAMFCCSWHPIGCRLWQESSMEFGMSYSQNIYLYGACTSLEFVCWFM